MIKKHLITCSVILVLVIISGLYYLQYNCKVQNVKTNARFTGYLHYIPK